MNKKKKFFLVSLIEGIYNIIKNFIKGIIRVIDKYIVMPITKMFLVVLEVLNKNTKTVEIFLNKKNTLVFISLLVSLAMFFLVDSKTLTMVETSAEVMYNQPVKVIYNEEKYVIEGIPEFVDITLVGRKSDLYLAKQLPINEISLDLSDLKPGTHRVDLKYKHAITSLDYKLDPSMVTVVVYPKKSNVKEINVDVLNKNKIDPKLNVESVILSKDEVIVKGADHNREKVSVVKALVDLNKLDIEQVGETVLKDVPLSAYDENGNKVDIELVPSKVDATISITSPSKELLIKVVPKGELSFGKAIRSITLDETKIIVYGDEYTLDKLKYLPVEVDVNALKQDAEYNVTIKKPVGVKHMSLKNIKVSLTVENEISKQIDGVNIEYKNLNLDYSVQAFSEEDSKISVIVKGTETVLNELDAENIKAYVDLSNYVPGEYEIDVKIEGDDPKVIYIAKQKKVKLKIISK